MFLPPGYSPKEDVDDRRILMEANKPEYMQWRLYHACCARDILIAKTREMRLVPHSTIGRYDGKKPHKCSSHFPEQALRYLGVNKVSGLKQYYRTEGLSHMNLEEHQLEFAEWDGDRETRFSVFCLVLPDGDREKH